MPAPSFLQGRVRVRGTVQGVGFRPFVYRVANELGLDGWVRNDGEGVEIAVCGTPEVVEVLLKRLKGQAPVLAHVESIEFSPELIEVPPGFKIRPSGAGRADTSIGADAAVCPDCLAELFTPGNRRYRYPFINCTHCGPRYTITGALPYDRPNTSMAAFTLCPACQVEYHSPLDRRFHAQPNACPICGPNLWLTQSGEKREELEDPLRAAVTRILAGEILAVKGLGGFHLMCDAQNHDAVARLRVRKQREAKPLAVMFANTASIAPFAECNDAESTLLQTRERPIVLLRKSTACDKRLSGVAPDVAWLGAMLPYTPIHYLLFHESAGRPSGLQWLTWPHPLALVCTSANPHDEPLVADNEEALTRLKGIADAFLLHNRDIVARCDDSVTRIRAAATSTEFCEDSTRAEQPTFFRRARGYTPRAIRLARPGPSVLACGAWLKNTICLTRRDEAFLSPHIGDLENSTTCDALERTVHHLCKVLEITPAIVAHDLHPDFFSSHFAGTFASQHGLRTMPVQHHHAHIAAVLAEHGHEGAAFGLALDGVGLGLDGTAWGGEMLRVEGARFERLGHLRHLPLPGGDRAAREPWRVAAGALFLSGRAEEIGQRWPGAASVALREMLERNLNSPLTSSAGRWFDAAAGILGVATHSSFEGQAAMRLEGLAEGYGVADPLDDGFILNEDGTLDLMPLFEVLCTIAEAPYGAALFHATLVKALSAWVTNFVARHGITTVALGGGCFLNHILTTQLASKLTAQGLRVLQACHAPPNDGGIALGQAWIALRRSYGD